ncbi:hypothetical protein Aca07nite_74680 [Actinoplanes capillaceus]|uniref:Uncharacterized protein n=1 Tax=Actinoplanes campanulatus TaxID=113559 RepID=A0ABQ3WVK9_9ACTN|nr:hypothetical protein Aca07nite_74680 [Actinoplanes capillaceus]
MGGRRGATFASFRTNRVLTSPDGPRSFDDTDARPPDNPLANRPASKYQHRDVPLSRYVFKRSARLIHIKDTHARAQMPLAIL